MPHDHSDPLARLQSAIDELAHLDPSDVAISDVAELALGLQKQRQRLDGLAAGLLGHWHDSGAWAFDGSRSAATHLARETRSSLTNCRKELRRARATNDLPAVTRAIIAGHLSIDHLDLFSAARTTARAPAMDRDEHDLVEHCRDLNFADARKLLAYWANACDASLSTPEPDEANSPSRLFLSETFEGTWQLDGALDPLSGGIVGGELDRLVAIIAQRDADSGTQRTPAQRRAAALVEMAQRSARASDQARPAQPLFTVLVGQDTLKHLCELAEGTVIAPDQLVPWLGTADYETILFDGPHTIVSVSHRRRFTGALRRAIEVRDRRCTHPSDCDIPASRCDVDHIVPYAQNGPTSQFNGRLQCATHNRNRSRHAASAGQRPAAHRTLTELDHIRGRLRWHYLEDHPDDPDDRSDEGNR